MQQELQSEPAHSKSGRSHGRRRSCSVPILPSSAARKEMTCTVFPRPMSCSRQMSTVTPGRLPRRSLSSWLAWVTLATRYHV